MRSVLFGLLATTAMACGVFGSSDDSKDDPGLPPPSTPQDNATPPPVGGEAPVVPARARPMTAAVPTPPPAPTSAGAPSLQAFHFRQGGSDKFWKIGAEGCDVTVVYGRAGTKGQTLVKTFPTPERAKLETAKLILEKTRKGYVASD